MHITVTLLNTATEQQSIQKTSFFETRSGGGENICGPLQIKITYYAGVLVAVNYTRFH